MLAYHNDPAVKSFHVEQARRHLAMDMLIRGTYGEGNGDNFKGCSVGCMAHDISPGANLGNLHRIVAKSAGWPEWLVYLSEAIFEGLPEGDRQHFHVSLREAIPVGVNLEPARVPFLLTLQRRNLARLLIKPEPYTVQCREAIQRVIDLLDDGGTAESELAEAAEAAKAVGRSGRRSVLSATWSAMWSAWSAAGSDVRSAAAAAEAAGSAALSAFSEFKTQRDDLLSILQRCT